MERSRQLEEDRENFLFAARSRERALECQLEEMGGLMEAMRRMVCTCDCGRRIIAYDHC